MSNLLLCSDQQYPVPVGLGVGWLDYGFVRRFEIAACPAPASPGTIPYGSELGAIQMAQI
jgi:hypothetical protein